MSKVYLGRMSKVYLGRPRSEFTLKASSAWYFEGQIFTDIEVEVFLPDSDSRHSYHYRNVPCSDQGLLDWQEWLDNVAQSPIPQPLPAIRPWLVQHWLGIRVLPFEIHQGERTNHPLILIWKE